ncbi:MAG: type II/IV secretion system protein [Opitutales bacterium]|nr:type II/IV secretion system protein [Opitutales bacterium]
MPANPNTVENLNKLLTALETEQRTMVLEAPRQNRLALLARFRRESEADSARLLAEASGLELVEELELAPNATSLLPARLIHEYQAVPLAGDSEDTLTLATCWPPEEGMEDWIYASTGKLPKWKICQAKDLSNTITQHFGVGADSLMEGGGTEDSGRAEADESEDENAAIIRFVNEIVAKALEDRATDIHFEPLKDSLQIRYRIDGELVPIRVPDNLVRYQGAIISRLKIMARLNISEKRRPQDGRIDFRAAGGAELDIRLSTIPTLYGESVSLRLLNQKNQPLSLDELGMLRSDQERIRRVLDLPHGIVLVTGPTGSGKSTSLTAFIRQINSPGRRIITVEDPVEYEVPGVNQTQVHNEIGYTFAQALRHILRQDPDVIMVGEIRDRETADIAIRASLTGHLVLSTLHTNDAPGALTRLIDMEIEPFLVASAVELILAQRLVRRLCPDCARPARLGPKELRAKLVALLGHDVPDSELEHVIMEPAGCESCRNLGYKGRLGLFEILRVDDSIHELIVGKESARSIRHEAIKNGMLTLQQNGWEQVKRGRTTLDEVMRFADIGNEEA